MNRDVPRSPDVCERLVHRAARRAPVELRERLDEEWRADLAERRGWLARLRFALGCAWASELIVAERPARLASAGAQGPMLRGGEDLLAGLSRRTLSLVLVIGLHAALLYVCWVSLATTAQGPRLPSDILNVPLHRDVPQAEHVSTLPPRLAPVPVPVPEVPPVARVEPALEGEVVAPNVKPPDALSPPETPAHALTRITGSPAAGFPNVEEFYPAAAIRAGQQGGAVVTVCVNQRGELSGEPSIERSSGFSSLDGAALRLAKAGSGHYRPSTEDGRPVAACFSYVARFRLKN